MQNAQYLSLDKLLGTFLLILSISIAYIHFDTNKNIKALIFCDQKRVWYSSIGQMQSRWIENLLGVRNIKAERFSINSPYVAKDPEMLFYEGTRAMQFVPEPIVWRAKSGKEITWWIGSNEEVLLKGYGKNKVGFRYSKNKSDFDKVLYRGFVFKTQPFFVTSINPEESEVMIAAENNLGSVAPILLRSKNLFFMTSHPFLGPDRKRYMALCDALARFLGVSEEPRPLGLIRLEDIHPMYDIKKLEAVIELLEKREIHFSIGVIPIFVNPAKKINIKLTDDPKLIEILKNAQSHGAQIFIHGLTHQFSGVTAVGYEFFNPRTQKPFPERITLEQLENRIREAKSIIEKAGLKIDGWETPHYMAPPILYKALKDEGIKTIYERVLLVDEIQFNNPLIVHQMLIYPSTYMGLYWIPEDFGYDGYNFTQKTVYNELKKHRAFSRGVVSFFFHSYLGKKQLEALLDSAEKDRVLFVNTNKLLKIYKIIK
ncbi:putative DUF2334 domain protein [Thermodesulfobium acidiphilum]|uniref:Putative DUF2334 domain protein n=2 Tax=Thermodesulfobium acidiphilum TaxID=1794699 RepID=A0A2R4VYC2_THEAF|nr:putative DUF2334 domain protein [Thermodesulfobium acidiphilum]